MLGVSAQRDDVDSHTLRAISGIQLTHSRGCAAYIGMRILRYCIRGKGEEQKQECATGATFERLTRSHFKCTASAVFWKVRHGFMLVLILE